MSTGFVVSDKMRRAVFVELMAGETDFERIVKKQRLIKPAAERALRELEAEKLVARDGGKGALKLTASGEEIAADIKRNDMLR